MVEGFINHKRTDHREEAEADPFGDLTEQASGAGAELVADYLHGYLGRGERCAEADSGGPLGLGDSHSDRDREDVEADRDSDGGNFREEEVLGQHRRGRLSNVAMGAMKVGRTGVECG